ncbi:unnamed protein product [Cunninghamella blakesleeana]
MTGFILEEPFPLSKFQNNIGIKNSNQNFITTVQKCLQSWTTPPGIQFGQPAIYHPSNGDTAASDYTYVLVDSGSDIIQNEERKTLWIWKGIQNNNNDNNAAGNRVSKTFQDRIQGVHTSASLRSNVILVYENGSIDLISNDLDRLTANYKTKSDELVLWSSVFLTTSAHARPCCIPNSVVPANSTMVITLRKSKEAKKYTIKLHCINEERRSINETVKIDLELQNEPVAYTFDPTLGIITILENDGIWTIYHLVIKRRTVNKIVSYLNQHHQTQFNGYHIYDNEVGKVASLASLSDQFVAMVAPRILQKGSKSVEHVLSIWDIKYGTLQAEKVIKVGEKQFSAGECTCNVNVLNNSHIAVTISTIQRGSTGSNKSSKKSVNAKSVITLFPYYHQPMSLLSAMNKMKSTASFLGIDQYSLTNEKNIGITRSGQAAIGHSVEFENNDEQTFKNWMIQLEKDQQSEDALIKSFTKKDITLDEFNALFLHHADISKNTWNSNDWNIKANDPAEKLDQEKFIYKKLYYKFERLPRNVSLSSQLITCILNQIFATNKNGKPDMKLWSERILIYLMAKNQLLSTYIKGGLIRGLLERQSWSLISIALKVVPDIPETDLILVIKELIHLRLKDLTVWESRVDYYLKAVVQAYRNDIFMQQALKRLSVQDLPIILESLIKWLDSTDAEGKSIIKKQDQTSDSIMRQNNIIDFANSLIDIHFPTIILESSLHPLIDELQKSLLTISDDTVGLEELHCILSPFERNRKLNQKSMLNKLKEKEEKKNAPVDKTLAAFSGAKYGGEEGIPVYRVEMFQF